MLVLPIVAGGLLLRPSSLLGLYAAAATALIIESVKLGPYTEGPSRVTPASCSWSPPADSSVC